MRAGEAHCTPEVSREGIIARRETTPRLRAAFRKLTDLDPAYWSYESIKGNANPQAYFQYPAMMVPRMQGDIIDAIKEVFPSPSLIFDPFAGSGTVLVESLKRSIDTLATDINPMAILLCKVKSQGFDVSKAESAFTEALRVFEDDCSVAIDIEYENRAKWFTEAALVSLSRLRRAIVQVSDLQMRRLLWVAFAEAVRISSNSRTTTYKLHIRDSEDIKRRTEGTSIRIRQAMERVLFMYKANQKALATSKAISNGLFSAMATIRNHDVREPIGCFRASAIISSPPYGDNHTTVTYGQHAFLPLCWIPLADIDASFDESLIENTHAIDSASLGGKRLDIKPKESKLIGRSTTLDTLLANPKLDADARKRLVSFFFDLDQSFENMLGILDPGGPIVLTLGNRCVSGLRVQTDSIVSELLTVRSCEFVDTHARGIPTKRMAHRNKSAGTMLTETLLVMRGPT